MPRLPALRPALAAILLVLSALLPQMAAAHAQLQGAEPPAQAVVEAAPPRVVLTFNEPVTVLSVVWTGPDGGTAPAPARTEGARVVIDPPAEAARGTHVVTWRVVSSDGHPVGGAHVFSIGATSAAMVAEDKAMAARIAAAGRAALTLALAFGVGGLAVGALLRAPVPGRLRPGALAVLPAAALMLAGQAADLDFDAGALLRSPFALAAGLAVLALALAWRGGAGRAGLALGAGGLSFAVAGHAGTAAAWAAPVVAVHGATALAWGGALAVLATPAGRAAGLGRFARLAPAMVAGLVASGAALALVQTDLPARGWPAVAATPYGQVLAAKLGLAALILALAAANRWWWAPGALGRSIRVELMLMAVLLALTAGFRLTPPPRALAEAAVLAHVHGRLAGGDLRILPGRPGENRVEIALHGADYGPITAEEVTVTLTHPALGLGPVGAPARQGDDGLWLATGLMLPAAGDWQLVVTVRTDSFTQERLGTTVALPAE